MPDAEIQDLREMPAPDAPPAYSPSVARIRAHLSCSATEQSKFLGQLRERATFNKQFVEAFFVNISEIPQLKDIAESLSLYSQSIGRKRSDGTVNRKAWLIVGTRQQFIKDVAATLEKEWKNKIQHRETSHRMLGPSSFRENLSALVFTVIVFGGWYFAFFEAYRFLVSFKWF